MRLLTCMIHGFHFFGTVTARVAEQQHCDLAVVRIDGQPRFHPWLLDFANFYGCVPQSYRPYRPETTVQVEPSIL